MVSFKNFLKTKSDPNIHQKHQIAPFKKILGGACSRTPLATSRSGMYFNTSYSLKLYHPYV